MRKIFYLLVCVLGLATFVQAAPANCEKNADDISFSPSGGYRTIKLVKSYDPDDDPPSYDETLGVYFFKAKLERGKSYTVWTEGIGTNEHISVSVYAADPSESSDAEGPSAEFSEMEEPQCDQRLVLSADDWYIDEDDPDESDPKSWIYYIEVDGDVGDTLTVHFQQGVVIPQGREDNPMMLYPSASTVSTVKRSLEIGNEYYFRTRLQEGRMYWFRTSGGTALNALNLVIEGEDPVDETKEAPECIVYDDPELDMASDDSGIYVIPRETGYFSLIVSGDTVSEADSSEKADAEGGAPFGLSYRLLATRAIADHAVEELEIGGAAPREFVAGSLSSLDRTTNGVYDAIIDESLFRFKAEVGARYVVETLGAVTNLLLRIYDAKGNVLVENAGDGIGLDVRGAFKASADGDYYVGVCQNLEDELNEVSARTKASILVTRVESKEGLPDAWDSVDDVAVTATALAPVPGIEADSPIVLDAKGHGWHRLDRTDWVDVYQIAARKGIAYRLGISLEEPTESSNVLRAEVFTLSGTTEKTVASTGDVVVDTADPLTFVATANTTCYIRLSVAGGVGLDYPAYKVHAMAYSTTSPSNAVLGTLTVNTFGTKNGTFSLGSETVKYAGGSSVVVLGPQTVKFGAVSGFSTPAATNVTVEAGTVPNVVDVYYSDTFDPKDDNAMTATAWALKNVETSMGRTLWPTDPGDNFSIVGKDGYCYDIALRDVTGDAVFSITNALQGIVVENVTNVHQLTLPTSPAKYILAVGHGSPSDAAGGSYTLAGYFANVGAIKFAKTEVAAKENAANVILTVNRTAKDGAVRVRYSTVDGTAVAGMDYVAQEGVLEWAANDNKAKTITVKLVPDLVATYDGNKTFSVRLEPVKVERPNEYPASILGGDTCTVTLTEVSKIGTTVASTYALKAPKLATVSTEKVDLSSGTFFGVLKAEDGALTNALPSLASVTFTASTAIPAALSAKVALAGKTYTFAAKGWDAEDEGARSKSFTLVQKVNNVVYTNTLDLVVTAGASTNGVDWLQSGGQVVLTMNVPDANAKGVQQDIRYTGEIYRQNAKIQDYLTAVTNFTGYYTVALAPEGVTTADGVPAGNGYLTITIDNKGQAKVAGMLADGVTKPSLSIAACALKEDAASANGYSLHVPIFFVKAPCCFGGLLRLLAVSSENLPSGADAQVVVDAKSSLLWANDNAALTYAGKEGYALSLAPCGGWYDSVFNLQAYYLGSALSIDTAKIEEFPKEALGAGYVYSTAAQPNGFGLEFVGDAITYEKKALIKTGTSIDLAKSVNVCNVAVKFARATGLYSGTCSLWSENETGTLQKEVTGVKHYGVLVLSRDSAAPIDPAILGAGFLTQSVKLSDYNETTQRTTTRTWGFSAPFNVRCTEE